MAGTRTTNTFSEEMLRLIQTVAGLRVLPDADLEFVTKLEELLTTRARMPEQQMAQAGMIPPQAQNPMGNAALGLPGLPPPGPALGGGGGIPIPPSPQLGADALTGVAAPGPGPSDAALAAILGGV